MSELIEMGDRGPSEPLPRDASRFLRLYPNGRVTIKDGASPFPRFLTSYELALSKAECR